MNDAISGKIDIPWKIKFIVHDIITFSHQLSNILFHHILREANFLMLIA